MTKEQQQAKRQRRVKVIEDRGRLFSRAEARNITWMAEDPPDLLWIVRVSMPFDYGYSKNAAWRSVRQGYVYLTAEARMLRAALSDAIKRALGARPIVQGKLWVDILVQKPDHRGDAVNFVDSICDAVKTATGLDDRWYSLRRLDWQIVKENPRLFVGIGQNIHENCRVCSSCGREMALTEFHRNRGSRDGYVRNCKDCTRGTRRMTEVVGTSLPARLEEESQ